MEFDPAIMNLFRGGETLDARRAPRIGDHYFVTGPVRLRSHFTLNRLVPAFEKVEHADGLLHGSGHGNGSAAKDPKAAQL